MARGARDERRDRLLASKFRALAQVDTALNRSTADAEFASQLRALNNAAAGKRRVQ